MKQNALENKIINNKPVMYAFRIFNYKRLWQIKVWDYYCNWMFGKNKCDMKKLFILFVQSILHCPCDR